MVPYEVIEIKAVEEVDTKVPLPEKAAEAGIAVHKAVVTGTSTVVSFFRGLVLGK